MRSTILPLSLFLLAPGASAQTMVNLGHQSKNVDFSQAPFTRPVQTGSTLPATCTVGDLYFHTGAEAGKNLYGCTGANTWIGLGGGALTLATQQEAESGIENTHYMSPLRSAQAVTAQCALPAQSGHTGKILKTDGSTATWTAFLNLLPSAAQTIDEAGDSITADALNVRISPNNNYTLTSTPTIADGTDGQLLLISNNSTSYSVTAQDEANLANSNLRLGGSNVTIGPRGSLLLTYNTALASWVRADTVGGGGGGGGITSLNSQAGVAQTFTTGASGIDFNISSASDTHTFNLPDASASARGAMTTGAQTFGGKKTFSPTSTVAGLNVGFATGDPSSPTNGDIYYNSSTNKFRCYQNGAWTDCIGSGGGGGGITTSILTFPGGNCQMGAASTGFALSGINYPAPYCLNTGSTLKGLLAFSDAATDEAVQWDIVLPPDWNSSAGIKLDVQWTQRSTDTGNVRWGVYGVCTADGEDISNPTFSSVFAFTDAAKGAAWQRNDTTQQTLTTSDVLAGCAANETLHLKFSRTSSHADDTFNDATAYLDKIGLTITRTP